MTLNAGLMTSSTPEWYTPPDLAAEIAAFFGGVIDLDPCADSDRSVPARMHYTRDGLTLPWNIRPDRPENTTVYMNPPYGRTINQWVEKAIAEPVGEVIMLLPARTDTAWFQPLLRSCAICFIAGRLRFSGAKSGAPFPSALVYWGYRPVWFACAFGHRGVVVYPAFEARVDLRV